LTQMAWLVERGILLQLVDEGRQRIIGRHCVG
jgi:hypothetical protein